MRIAWAILYPDGTATFHKEEPDRFSHPWGCRIIKMVYAEVIDD